LGILLLALVGVIPPRSHGSKWRHGRSGGVGLMLVIVLISFVLGKI